MKTITPHVCTILLMTLFLSPGLKAQNQLGMDINGTQNVSQFGQAVAISGNGNRIVVGSPLYDVNGSNTGLAKVYEFVSGSWQQIGLDLVGNDAGEEAGTAVAINESGSRIAIGSPLNNLAGTGAGQVRVFEYDNNAWSQLGGDLLGTTAGDRFGISVAMNATGTIIAVGASEANSGRGLVRIYEYTQGAWTQLGNEILGEAANNFSGKAISLNAQGTHIAIGAELNNDNGANAGHVRVYQYTGTTWEQVGLDIDGDAAGDRSGSSVSLNADGSRVAIGARTHSANGYASGQVRVFEYTGSNWTLLGSKINGSNAGIQLGTSLSLNNDGDQLIAGAPYDGTNGYASGQSTMYALNNESWDLTSTIIGESFDSLSGFSTSMSADGARVVVGEYGNSENGFFSGQARVFTTNQTNTFEVAAGNWSDVNSWSLNRLPTTTDNIVVPAGNSLTIDLSNVSVNNFIIDAAASVILDSDKSLTVGGNLNINGDLTINSGASLIAEAEATGQIKYKRWLPSDNWYLVSPPVVNQAYASLINNNAIATGTGANLGVALYNNSGAGWVYFQAGPQGGAHVDAMGLAVKLTGPGNLEFEGALNTTDENIPIFVGASINPFNLIGNPYPSYLPANNSANFESNILLDSASSLSEMTLWFWDGTLDSYITVNQATAAHFIPPGQAFFVSSLPGVDRSVVFKKSMQSHQSVDGFVKPATNNRPEIRLHLSNGHHSKFTDVYFIQGMTHGFDNGFDSSEIPIETNNLRFYTGLLEGSDKELAIQTLADTSLDNVTIPLGVHAWFGQELTFAMEKTNIPTGVYVYLEDRLKSAFIPFDEATTSYKVLLTESQNGTGRFYLHLTSQPLSNPSQGEVTPVKVYQSDRTLVVSGLQQPTQLSLYDLMGKKVFSTALKSTTRSETVLPVLNPGVYIAVIQQKIGTVSKKIILN